MKLQPLADRVIVRPLEAEERTKSGLYIPDQAQERPQRGVVLSVGPGRMEDDARIPMQVGEGDEVIYARYGGTEITIDGVDLMILRETDILAIANSN